MGVNVEPPPHRVYLGGLPPTVTEREILDVLKKADSKAGHVQIARNAYDDLCRGFAHAACSSAEALAKVIKLENVEIAGKKIRIESAAEHWLTKWKREQRGEEKMPDAVPRGSGARYHPSHEAWGKEEEDEAEDDTTPKEVTPKEVDDAKEVKRTAPHTAKPPRGSGETRRTKEELLAAKAAAVEAEDYAEAQRLKNELQILELEERKRAAVEAEDYEQAAKIKAEIATLQGAGKQDPAPAKTEATDKEGCKRCSVGQPCARHGNKEEQAEAKAAKAAAKAAAAAEKEVLKAKKKAEANGCRRCFLGKVCTKHNTGGVGEKAVEEKGEEETTEQKGEEETAEKKGEEMEEKAAKKGSEVPRSPPLC
eukprot:Sspe_Gene.35944::Locus_17408_Transcript_1_1_Confidence_1.000_Length_1462::g.35944::m.35944